MTRFDGPLSGEKITVVSADGPNVVIQDSDLLFTAHFSRSGHDLILTGDHGKSVVVLDYFSQSDMPALSSPEGATLQPHVVNALAGPMAPGQYAQAGDQQPADSIGKVVTLEGSATAQRTDGTVVQLNVGDQVAQGDVLQTADGSALGLVFVDGTVFSLTGASRMVLDNLVYQAGGSNNSLTFDVVQGTFSFVAGQVAPTGEMRIETPVASLGIRGTTPGGICANGGPCTFFISPDPGTNHVGSFLLLGSAGQILQTINNPTFQYTVSAGGAVVTEPLDPSVAEIINKLIQAFERRASEGEEKKEGEDGSDPNGETNAADAGAGGSGIESFNLSYSAIQTGLPTDGIESLTQETMETTKDTTTTASTSDTTNTGSTTGDTGNDNTPPDQPDDSIDDDIGTTGEDGGGTTGTVDASGAVVPQTGTEGQFGTFTIDQDGDWSYTLNDSAQALGEGDTALDAFTVTTENGATATVFITITGTNDTPIASAVPLTSVSEDSGARIITQAELLAGVTDPDGPNLTITALSIATGSGLLIDNGNGTWTYTPSGNDDTGVTFNYTVFDGTASSSSTASLDITPVNDAPTASPVTLAAIAEDSGARIITQAELLAGVSDPDGPSLTITSLSIATGAGSLVNNEDGTWTYTPAANDDTGVTFNYTVSDGTTPASSTASLDITPVIDAPTASPVTLTAIAENSGGRLITQAELLAGVTDPDGPSLTITSLSISTGGGVLVNNGNGTWTYTPAEDDDSSVTFNYTASDGTLSSSSTASLDITTVNEPPVLTGDLEADINNDASYILTTDDLGFSDGDGDTDVVFTVSNLVNGSILVDGVIATSFTYADIQNGLVSFEHDGSETSQAYFDVSVEDGNEDGSTPVSQTFTLNVTNYITGDENPNVLNGTAAVDVISGLEDDDTITGNGDDDILIGGAGADTYVWNENDGFDTIMGDNLSQDIVRIEGGPFYDYNFEIDGDDLLIGVTADSDYGWSAGGNLRVEDFFNDGDTIAYLQADLGPLNEFYNPDGEGADARIYFSAGAGIDQGHYYEVILGTDIGETITDTGGTWINRLYGYGGNDTLIAADSGPSVLLGGNGDDTLIGGTNDDELRGGSGSDDIDGGDGYDTLAYHRPATSGQFTHGVFVNLSNEAAVWTFNDGESTTEQTVAAHSALDNWWDPDSPTVGVDTIANVEAVLGTQFDDVIIGGDSSETITGGAGADFLDGGGGESGYDTVDYYPPFGSPAVTQGVFVNISNEVATYDFNGDLDVSVGVSQAIDNWGNWDLIQNFENIRGSDLDDVLVAGSDYNYIDGGWGDDIIVGGGGYDTLVGGGGSDSFVFGTEWNYTWINDFELGTDLLRLQGDVYITYEAYDSDYDYENDSTLVTLWSGEFATGSVVLVGVTDVEDVSQLLAPPILGDGNPNTIDGTVFNDVIEGGQEDDTLNGRAGVDTYVWNGGDGYDTIVGDDSSEDIIEFVGSFYDFNWEYDGNDLIIGVVDDDNYVFDGSIRLEDFTAGGDSIAYLEADLDTGPENYNLYYSPERGGEISRIYLSAIDGIDQGSDFELIVGTSGDDTMIDAGGTGLNRFDGRDGNDTITGSIEGRNVLQGGNGHDTLTGGAFNDQFRGGAGNDAIYGGDDEGEFGGDLVRYDRNAGSGPYTHGVVVNLSDDSIVVSDDPGEDEYYFDGIGAAATVASNQAIGNWENLATWASLPANRVDTDTLSGIESVRGSTFDDVLIGSDGDNNLIGDQGDDTIIAGGGNDFIVASFGSDYIDGGDGEYDHVWYEELNGVEINLADGYADEGGGIVDTLVNIESISGSRGADTLIGDDGDNILQGLAGDDYLDGAGGFDSIDFYAAPAGVIVDLGAGTASDGYGDTDTFVGIEGILGSFHDDTLTGTTSNNYIDGRGGDDTIRGYGGNDNLVGGEGFDIFVFGEQNEYTDIAQIQDFIVGTDYLRLEDGVSLNDIGEWVVDDFNNDDILDTRITIIDANSFEDGYIELLGVSGVTDVNDLLEPPSFFSMAFMSFDEGGEFDTQIVSTTGALESDLDSSDASGQRGWGGRGGGHGRRGDEGRTNEFAFVQAAAAVAGVTVVAPQFAHAAEGSSTQPGAEAQPVQAHGDGQGWMPGSIAGQHAGGSINHSAIQAAVPEPTGNAGSLSASHDRPEITQLRDAGQDAPERTSSNDREWKGAASGEDDSGAARAAQHAGNEGGTPPAPQGNGGEGPATSHAAPEPADAQHGGGGWTGASLPDTMPILDFSSLPVGGAATHSFAEGSHQIELKLPAFESVIDLRHDFFAEIPKHPNAGAIGEGHEGRSGTGEWAHAGVAEFVHNLANDLEAAVQNHDAR